jgi:conjugal transfer/entry exclusion protein
MLCRSYQVGPDFSEDPLTMSKSRSVIKVEWHPLSKVHLSVLSSDNTLRYVYLHVVILFILIVLFRLYNLSVNPSEPEQEFILLTPQSGEHYSASQLETPVKHSGRIGLDLNYSTDSSASSTKQQSVVSFVYGGERGWERFTIFYITDKGKIYAIVPVVPFGWYVYSFFKKNILTTCYYSLIVDSYFQELDDDTIDRNAFINFYDSISNGYIDVPIQRADEKLLHESAILASPLQSDTTPQEIIRFIETKPHNHRLFKCATRQHTLCPIGPFNLETDLQDRLKYFTNYSISDFTLLSHGVSAFICVNIRGHLQALVLLDTIQPILNHSSSSSSSRTDEYDISTVTHTPEVSLIAYDDVDLELKVEDSKSITPYLVTHALAKQSVYCVHSTGVHQVNFPFLKGIERYFTHPEQEVSLATSSAIQILDTKVLSNTAFTPVGIGSVTDAEIGLYVLVVDSDRNLYILNIYPFTTHSDYELGQDESATTVETLTPLSVLIDQEVQKISTIPTLAPHKIDAKMPGAAKLILDASNKFHGGHVMQLEVINQIINRRIKLLEKLHKNQQNLVVSLSGVVDKKIQKQEAIVKKIEEVKKKQQQIDDKAKKLADYIVSHSPESNASKKFRELLATKEEEIKLWNEKIQEIEKRKNLLNVQSQNQGGGLPADKENKIKYHLKGTMEVMTQTTKKMKDMRTNLTEIKGAKSIRPPSPQKRTSGTLAGQFGLLDDEED